MKFLKSFCLIFLFNFSQLYSQDYLDEKDKADLSGYTEDLTVSWNDSIPTSFEPDMPEDIKEDLIKKQDIIVNIPFFGYIIVSKIEDEYGNKIWKSVPQSREKKVNFGDNITFTDFDVLIDKNKKLTFTSSSDIYGTKGNVTLKKSKFGVKSDKLINFYGAIFVFDFVNKPIFKPFSGASITADKIELSLKKNLTEIFVDFKDAQVAEFGKIDTGRLILTRERGEKPNINLTGAGTLTLPQIGQVSYKLTSSLNTAGNFLLKASMKDIVYKDLNLKKVKAVFNTDTKEFKIKGRADVLGFEVIITLKKSGQDWSLKGKINKDVILAVPFYDGRVLNFTNGEFLIVNDKMQIKAYSKIDTTPITLTLTIANRSSAQFEITDSTVSQLVPSSVNTQVGDIKIHNILGKITSGKINIFEPKIKTEVGLPSDDADFIDDVPEIDYKEYTASEQGLEFLITGQANLSSVFPEMKDLDVLVTVSGGPKSGFYLSASLDNIELPEFGKISNAKAFISIPSCGAKYGPQKTKKELEKEATFIDKPFLCPGLSVGISGTGEADLPQIGHVKYALSSSIENGALVLTAELGDITYNGMKIEKAYAMFNTRTKDFEIIGHTNLLDINIPTQNKSKNINDFKIKVILKRMTSEQTTSVKYYSFTGIVEGEFQPIKNVPVSLLNGTVSFDKSEGDTKFLIAGDVKIEDHILSSTSRYIRNSERDLFMIGASLIEAGPKAKDWTLSSLSPVFKNTPFEELRVSAATLIVSSDSYKDVLLDEEILPGLNFSADFEDFITPFGNLKNLLANTKNKAKVFGNLNFKNIRDSSLGIKFDVGLKDLNSGSKIKSGGVSLAISGVPSVDFAFKILVDIDKSQPPLGFSFGLDLDIKQNINISGDMSGCWVDPFQIKGVKVCDLGLELGLNIVQLIATGLPSGLGFKGAIEVPGTAGKKKFIVAMGVNTSSPEHNYIVAELKGELTLAEIVGFVFELADGIAKDPNSKSKNNKLATTNSIDLKKVPELSIKDVLLKVVPEGKSITVGDEVYDPGFTFKGKMNLFGKNLLIAIETNEFGASGEAYLEKIEVKDVFLLTGAGPDKKYGTDDDGAYVSLALTPLDQHIAISGKIALGLENFRIIESETNIYVSPGEGLKFSSETSLFGTDVKASMTAIIPGVEDVLKDKDALLKTGLDIYFKNEFTDRLKNQIIEGLKVADKELQKSADDANKAFDKAIKDLENEKNAGINKANKDLDKLQKDLDNAKREWNKLSKAEQAYRWTDLGSKIAGLETAVKSGKALVNKLGKPVLTVTQEMIDKAGRQVSKTVLKGTNLIVQVGGKYVVVEGLSKLYQEFAINEVYFHGTVGEIQNGHMPKIKVVITLSGQRHTIEGELDFKNIGKSFEALGNLIKDQILKLFKK